MNKEILTPDHIRWQEFTEILGGEQYCNFREEIKGDPASITWECSSLKDKPFAKAILENMGNINIDATMHYFESKGGFCDCEILLNVDI